jgi:CheY-like chemotaxis protein
MFDQSEFFVIRPNVPQWILADLIQNGDIPHSANNTTSKKKSREKRRARILVVEDELLVAENLKEMLQTGGYEVIGILPSGEQAIVKFPALDPDLIMMDIRLAGSIDGIQTAIVIHYTLKKIPIIFLTAYPENQFPHLSAVQPPLYSYLTKPCDASELITTVETLLTRIKDQNKK